jgi:hypothetical protein
MSDDYVKNEIFNLGGADCLPSSLLILQQYSDPGEGALFNVNPNNRSWSEGKPLVLSLSKHEQLPHAHPFGKHSKIPLPFDKLRANGILECSAAVFRVMQS